MKLTLNEKSVYGRSLWYPGNDKAKVLAKLLGQKTIHDHQFALIKELGFELTLVPIPE